ncbi:hypothetical protein KO495_06780 [Colwellia sp. D2M02]|uniref:Uncharacterized protein n=1 Tax=Colwellia asteriadis TaxID=517723 RepID=A0ABN1L2D9_9GAMM|nr:hypothetical protein [Colwellia sp. D2M02]MBU2893029.1 hypothetical protein [Colwellia sp. D2M02]
MTIEKQRHYLLNGNRAIIYISSLIGVFFDANLAYLLALTLWVWLEPLLSLELALLKLLIQLH